MTASLTLVAVWLLQFGLTPVTTQILPPESTTLPAMRFVDFVAVAGHILSCIASAGLAILLLRDACGLIWPIGIVGATANFISIAVQFVSIPTSVGSIATLLLLPSVVIVIGIFSIRTRKSYMPILSFVFAILWLLFFVLVPWGRMLTGIVGVFSFGGLFYAMFFLFLFPLWLGIEVWKILRNRKRCIAAGFARDGSAGASPSR
ncbi:MAG: hypothetical protein AB7N71_11480 [Phycisphaerae bacterium]